MIPFVIEIRGGEEAEIATRSCRYGLETIEGYFDGLLTATQMIEIKNHLRYCKTCQSRIFRIIEKMGGNDD